MYPFKRKTERNKLIREERKKGATHQELADKYRVSMTRVWQIVNEKKALAELRKRMETKADEGKLPPMALPSLESVTKRRKKK